MSLQLLTMAWVWTPHELFCLPQSPSKFQVRQLDSPFCFLLGWEAVAGDVSASPGRREALVAGEVRRGKD